MHKNCLRIIGLSFIVLLLLSGCGKGGDHKYSFCYQPFGSNYAFFVAMDKGFFEAEGLDISAEKIISANDAATAMINGQIIGNATLPLNVLLSIEARDPGHFQIIGFKTTSREIWSDYLLVRKDSDIHDLADLAGKRVGGYPGSAQQTILRLVLEKAMDKDEIVTTEISPATQLQTLENGQIDALLTYDVSAYIALNSGLARVLEENPICKHIVDPLYGFPYVLSSQFVNEHPEDAKKFVRAFDKAIDYINTHETECRGIMASWSGIEPDVGNNVKLWGQEKVSDIQMAEVQKLADIFYEEGVVDKEISVSNLFYQ